MLTIDRNERRVEIHHIFPRKWCDDQKIPPKVYNSIINKTAISLKANRKISGNAPSAYLTTIQKEKTVQLDDTAMDEILASHSIEPALLRNDDFLGFYKTRRAALLSMVEKAMGKSAIMVSEAVTEDAEDTEEEDVEEVEELVS